MSFPYRQPGTTAQPTGPQMNNDPGGMGGYPPFPGRQVPPFFMPAPSPVPLPITPGNQNNPPMQYFMAPQRTMPFPGAPSNPFGLSQGQSFPYPSSSSPQPNGTAGSGSYNMQSFMSPRSMQAFQETPPPPSPPTSSGGGTYNAGNGGGVFGSANGGTIENGAILINGVYYPIANGGTVIGSADGGSGNSATSTTSMGGPSAPPSGAPPSGPPPGAIEDPNGGPPSPDAMRSFMAPQRTMPTFGPPPPSPLTRPTKPGFSIPPYITDPGFAAPPYRPPFNQQQSPFPAPPKYGY